MTRRREEAEVPKRPRASYIKCDCGCRASLSIVNEAGELDLMIVKQHATMVAKAKMFLKYGDDESKWPSGSEMMRAIVSEMGKKAEPRREEPGAATIPNRPIEPTMTPRRSGRDLF